MSGFSCFRAFVIGCSLLAAASAPLIAETVTPSPYWRNTISFPSDSFRSQGSAAEDLGWIKFTIFVGDQTQVYFQDSNQFPFHYDFGAALVAEYAGMTHEQFDAITLHAAGQQAILGTVIMPHWTSSTPPAQAVKEYGIQLVRQDAYDPTVVVSLFNLVKSKITAEAGTKAFYFPTFEQYASAEQNQAYLFANGVEISSPSRWAKGNIVYSLGWALGTLKFFTASQIDAAYLSGQLLPGDILLTDGVPAEVPLVAGILSLVPSTPSSHVAILCNTYNIPFAHLAIAADAAQAQALVGKKVLLRTYVSNGVAGTQLTDVTNTLTPQQIEEILVLKTPPPLDIEPVTPYTAYSASAEGLYPSDIRYFGGKAANFGMVRRSVPDDSPVATAFSFDLWTEFMAQLRLDGRTLSDTIRSRLAGYTYPPASMSALSADLAAIRDIIEKDTTFSPALQTAIIAVLQDPQYGFDPMRNIRFRSSTNVEDSEQFTGAGLYDSFSGCLADDLDGDTAGPSLCDPTETKERGVFRAIRKVYASFYNDNAFLARLQYSVDESQVGMGLLVHHSTPDPIEMANGVATLERKSATEISITLVTQQGAVSVTNPPAGSVPEEIRATILGIDKPALTIIGYSNLMPLGATVLEWQQEYLDLVDLLTAVAEEFEAVSGKATYLLDFEYKKVAPEGLLRIKQVRELPKRESMAGTVPFLLGGTVQFCTDQGEFEDAFSKHRLKSRWTLRTRSMWLTPDELAAGSLYAELTCEHVRDGQVVTSSGDPAAWPAFSHSYSTTTNYHQTTDALRINDVENPREYQLLTSNIPATRAVTASPFVTAADLAPGRLRWNAHYDKIEPAWDYNHATTTRNDSIRFSNCPEPRAGERLQLMTATASTVTIESKYYWPPPPTGGIYIWTNPLQRFLRTTISGYTSQPIVLTGYYSQTYHPHHHNFGEEFVFEPGLEPGLNPALLAELRSKNIRTIHVYLDYPSTTTITTFGYVAPGDFDHNSLVNMTDLEHFEHCHAGALVPWPYEDCYDADLDHDLDVDQSDFGLFQRCISGTLQANVNCLGQE